MPGLANLIPQKRIDEPLNLVVTNEFMLKFAMAMLHWFDGWLVAFPVPTSFSRSWWTRRGSGARQFLWTVTSTKHSLVLRWFQAGCASPLRRMLCWFMVRTCIAVSFHLFETIWQRIPAEDPTEATEASEPAADGNVEAASEAPSEGEKESSQCQSPSLNSKKSVPTGLTAAKSKAAPPKGAQIGTKGPKGTVCGSICTESWTAARYWTHPACLQDRVSRLCFSPWIPCCLWFERVPLMARRRRWAKLKSDASTCWSRKQLRQLQQCGQLCGSCDPNSSSSVVR